jgi:hypothetical protein
MTVVNSIWKWLCEPVNAVISITYATAIAQSVAAETGWRWARVVANVPEASRLPLSRAKSYELTSRHSRRRGPFRRTIPNRNGHSCP